MPEKPVALSTVARMGIALRRHVRKPIQVVPFPLALVLAASTQHGCAPATEEDPAQTEIEALYTTGLTAIAAGQGVEAKLLNGQLQIGDHGIRLDPIVEEEGTADGRHFVGIAVEVSVDGSPVPLTTGSVGFGTSRQEAIEVAASEWVQLVGPGLVPAVFPSPGVQESIAVADLLAFPGATGVRGSQDILFTDESHEQILSLLEPVLLQAGMGDGSLHSVSIVLVRQGGSVEGECRIDTQPSAGAFRAIQAFPWPHPTEGYIFKQFYVLHRAP